MLSSAGAPVCSGAHQLSLWVPVVGPQYLCHLEYTAHYGSPPSPDPLHCLNHHPLK